MPAYTVLRRIGMGGMAEVYLARGATADGGVGLFALKRLLPELESEGEIVRMFEDEARLAAQLVHPSICRVFGMRHDGESHYQVMEWLDGVTLRWLVDESRSMGGLPVEVVTRIGFDVADALDHAHLMRDSHGIGLGVVHRDVSPPNVMITFDGEVKLLDFGLAKARTQLTKTRPGWVKGKFGYLAPEQLRGLCDARTDVFQLGLCLYEALTSERLFPHETAAGAVSAIAAYETPPSIRDRRPELDPTLEWVIQRAIDPDPDVRFQTAAELRDALRDGSGGDVGEGVRLALVVDMLLPADDRRPAFAEPALADPAATAIAAADADADESPPRRLWPWLLAGLLLAATGFALTALLLQ